jgi:hypothetical protein
MDGPTAVGLLAVESTAALVVREWDLPQSPLGWLLWLGATVAVMAFVIWQYRRDTLEYSWPVRLWLTSLRLLTWLGVWLIALNPQDRTQRTSIRPSRVAIVVDNSLSMRHPAGEIEATEAAGPSRSAAALQLLQQQQLIETLRKTHEVSLYTFGATLEGPHQVWSRFRGDGSDEPTFPASGQPGNVNGAAGPSTSSAGAAPAPNSAEKGATAGTAGSDPSDNATATTSVDSKQAVGTESPADADDAQLTAADWPARLQPQQVETRLGESLQELLRQIAVGRTLSGVVVISDGGQNAGVEPAAARDRALQTKTRLITVAVGGTNQPQNVQIADVQSPTDVQLGDKFDLSVFLQGQGLPQGTVQLELSSAMEADGENFQAVAQQSLDLAEGAQLTEARMSLQPTAVGAWQYRLKVTPPAGVREFNDLDNQQIVRVNVFDRPTKVLLLAGGPMRDYQFVRNLLYRHKSFDVDVLLQTAGPGTSQESDELLVRFPESREQLYEYDLVLAFDPDWRLISAESLTLLRDWVFQEGGGLVLIAGDVNTVQLAAVGQQSTPLQEQLGPLQELYPVVLNSYVAELRFEQESNQPWPLEFTTEGTRSEFLQLTDDPVTSLARWKEFPGFYRCYPTAGAKAGATVYVRFSDPRSQNEYGAPILLAEQFYGQGRTLYLGSPEIWRLRAISEDDYDRFWIKTLREVGQGRTKRGTKRGVLLPESRKLLLGQTSRWRARLLDGQFQPLTIDAVPLEVFDPTGKPMVPRPRLVRDQSRPGEYVGSFRAGVPGTYRVALEVPDSRDRLEEMLAVSVPRLEDQDVRQNAAVLQELVRDTGGSYVPINEAAEKIPAMLPSREEPVTVDERLRSLWDRWWVLWLLVGLLSAEWLSRKLLKLS